MGGRAPGTGEHEGDRQERFRALFDEHYSAVARYASRHGDSSGGHDVAAETLTVAWRRLDQVPDNARPWLLAVARKVQANQRRGERRQMKVCSVMARSTSLTAPNHADDIGRLTDAVVAMRRLSAPDQEVLALVSWDDLDATSAAAVLGCTKTAFRVRLHRARRRLERALSVADLSQPTVSHATQQEEIA